MKDLTAKLGQREISNNSMPYVIAEIGVNHEGSKEKAYELIRLAKEGGADAAKFQTYKAEKIASKNSPSYWDLSKESTESQFKLFKKYDSFNENDYRDLANYCQEMKIDFLSTAFDHDAVDFLFELMPFYKIASADITNVPLLRKIGSKEKAVVVSTGASNYEEIDFCLRLLSEFNIPSISLLHCILNYPTPDEYAYLDMIKSLKYKYPNHLIGYSDHTLPDGHMTSLTTAFNYGACIIEKHFTDDKSLPGNDHYHAMDKEDLLILTDQLKKIFELKGNKSTKEPIKSEDISRKNARRSIVAVRDLVEGEKITEENITYKRPCYGIPISEWDKVLGKVINKNISEDSFINWEDLI
jgi:N-acetylneuraminate synthase|tara:strand:+ start:2049 stop:3113 length:1065 start_codon:yes stop_codon:yes gene_type:complete